MNYLKTPHLAYVKDISRVPVSSIYFITFMKRSMGDACGVLFLDLSKDFDTVDHTIVKLKLKSLGIKESSSRRY